MKTHSKFIIVYLNYAERLNIFTSENKNYVAVGKINVINKRNNAQEFDIAIAIKKNMCYYQRKRKITIQNFK